MTDRYRTHAGLALLAAQALFWSSSAAAQDQTAGAQNETIAAQDETIVVTATGLAQARAETGQAVTVIDAPAMDRAAARTVADLLADTPSVRVNSNGALGSVTSISLRGAETGQTLVLLDGVRIGDPSGTSGAVDFGNLLAGNIRRIEVLRGANALAYGSDAIGGVINLSTRDKIAGEGLSARASAEGGYAGTLAGTADLGWGGDGLHVDAGLAGLRSDGISSAASRFGARERDGVDNLTGHVRVEAALSDALTLDLRGYGVDARLDYDSFFGAPADSADTSHFQQATGYAGLRARSFGGRLESRLALTMLANRRDYRFVPEGPVDFGYRGKRWRLDYEAGLTLDPSLRLMLGLSHDAPDYRFFGFGSDEQHHADTDSGFLMAVVHPLPGLTLTGGARHDVHSRFGGITTVGANANYALADGQTHVRAAFGQGFRAPSLYQLYDGYSGNGALRPERSQSVDLGVDRGFAGGAGRVSLTLFTRATRNQIDYDNATFRYGNLARTRARGLELSMEVTPVRDLDVALAYSLIDTRDRSAGSASYDAHLPRRPVHSASLALDRRWPMGLSTGVTLRVVSDARDPTAPSGTLDAYALVGLRAALPVTKSIQLYARLDNALNARYETSYGYSSYGRSAYGGLRLTW